MLRKPSPSLLSVPPNKLVIVFRTLVDARWVARQTMLMPFISGNIYDGMTSKQNMAINADQNNLTR